MTTTAPVYDFCRFGSRNCGTSASTPTLSPREQQVLHALADGHTVECTARRLHLSVSTVRTHRMHVLDKLRAANGAHAVSIAYRTGLLDHRAAR